MIRYTKYIPYMYIVKDHLCHIFNTNVHSLDVEHVYYTCIGYTCNLPVIHT